MQKKIVLSVAASAALVMSAVPFAQAAPVMMPKVSEGATSETYEGMRSVQNVSTVHMANLQGVFTCDQGVRASNDELSRMLYRGSAYLCGAQAAEAVADQEALEGPISSIEVSGDVKHAFTASISEFEKKAPVSKVMGCTCAGNPADGRASANAAVTGFRLSALLQQVEPDERANTITFVSRDGYKVSLPLSYVTQRYSIIVTGVNDEATNAAVGCENQLWLGSTSARYFARDIVAVEITCEDQPPAVPGAPADANLPNVGVIQGS